MSRGNLVKLLEAAADDDDLRQQLQGAESYDQIRSVAEEHGFDLDAPNADDSWRAARAMARGNGDELTEEELNQVAGGVKCDVHPRMGSPERPSRTRGLLNDDGPI